MSTLGPGQWRWVHSAHCLWAGPGPGWVREGTRQAARERSDWHPFPPQAGDIFRDLFWAGLELNNNIPAWVSSDTGSKTLLGSRDLCWLVCCPMPAAPILPVPGQRPPVRCRPLRSAVHPQMGERGERARGLS